MEHTDDRNVCFACVIINTGIMFRDRGFTEEAEVPVPLPEELLVLATIQRQTPTGEAIMAVVLEDVGVTTARALVEYLGSLPEGWSMVAIANTKFTTPAYSELHAMHIELFKTAELSSNKRYNRMVPRNCRLLSREETAALKTTIIDLNRLAVIRTTDFIRRYYNAPVGAVYEVQVRNGQLPMRIKHRIVRDDMD